MAVSGQHGVESLPASTAGGAPTMFSNFSASNIEPTIASTSTDRVPPGSSGHRMLSSEENAEFSGDEAQVFLAEQTAGIEKQDPPSIQAKTRSHWRHIARLWLWEIAACFLSMACFLGIVGALAYAQGKPLSDWGLPISPNSLVSFIMTLSKTAFLFVVSVSLSQLQWMHFQKQPRPVLDIDDFNSASRGPLGALVFLQKHHVRATVASYAALVVVVSLFVEPFVQLVISYPTPTLPSQNPLRLASTFRAASLYDPSGRIFSLESSNANSLNTPMQAAIVEGFLSDPVLPSVECPTGNCTWSDVTTMSITGSCIDITPEIATYCSHEGWQWAHYGCNYTMPSGFVLSARNVFKGVNVNWEDPGSDFTQDDGWEQPWVPTRWNSTFGYVRPTNEGECALVGYFEGVQIPVARTRSSIPPVKGWACGLALSTTNYKTVNVTQGVVSTSEPIVNMLGFKNYTNCTTCANHQTLINLLPTSETTWSTNRLFQLEHGPLYQFNLAEYFSISDYMSQMFSVGWWNDGIYAPTTGDVGWRSAPDVGRHLASSNNLSTTIGQLGERMSEVIRYSPNGSHVQGQTLITQTYIRVQWAWLAAPLALIVMTIFLLFVVITEAQRSKSPIWKQSSLALLLHHWRGSTEAADQCNDVDELREALRFKSGLLSHESPMTFTESG